MLSSFFSLYIMGFIMSDFLAFKKQYEVSQPEPWKQPVIVV